MTPNEILFTKISYEQNTMALDAHLSKNMFITPLEMFGLD